MFKNFFERFKQFETDQASSAVADEPIQAPLPPLSSLPELELGPFPFSVLWDEDRERGSLLRFVPLVNFFFILLILIIVIAK